MSGAGGLHCLHYLYTTSARDLHVHCRPKWLTHIHVYNCSCVLLVLYSLVAQHLKQCGSLTIFELLDQPTSELGQAHTQSACLTFLKLSQ